MITERSQMKNLRPLVLFVGVINGLRVGAAPRVCPNNKERPACPYIPKITGRHGGLPLRLVLPNSHKKLKNA